MTKVYVEKCPFLPLRVELDGRLGPDAGELLEHSDVGRVEDAEDEAVVLLLVLGAPVTPHLQRVHSRTWCCRRPHWLWGRRRRLQHRNPFAPPQRGRRVLVRDGKALESCRCQCFRCNHSTTARR